MVKLYAVNVLLSIKNLITSVDKLILIHTFLSIILLKLWIIFAKIAILVLVIHNPVHKRPLWMLIKSPKKPYLIRITGFIIPLFPLRDEAFFFYRIIITLLCLFLWISEVFFLPFCIIHRKTLNIVDYFSEVTTCRLANKLNWLKSGIQLCP